MTEEVHYAPGLLDVVFWVWLQGMHHIRKFHSIADEESVQAATVADQLTFIVGLHNVFSVHLQGTDHSLALMSAKCEMHMRMLMYEV